MNDSPAKKLDFKAAEKENLYANDEVAVPIVGIPELDFDEECVQPAVSALAKPEECDEPLLQENPHRFVLFPIKYHEVGVPSTRFYA
jgi:ribonucleoside-diphosphate reductase subunit M2